MHEKGKPIALMVVVSLLGMVFAGSFLGALHHVEPHDVPVAVVAPDAMVEQLGAKMDQKAEGAFDLAAYGSEGDARDALMNRDVDAVFVPGQGGAKLILAGATGRIENGVLTEAFQAAGQATGQPVAVTDVAPLPDGDNNGISSIFFVITTVIPAVIMAVMFAFALPRAGAGRRLALLAAGSVVVGGANAWTAAGIVGALVGAPLELWGLTSLLVFAVSAFTAGALRMAGPPGAALTALLFVPIGLPASGGPMGPRFIPEWYAAFGEWLPPAAGINAVRNAVYFDGNAIGGPLLVLAAWAAVGVLLVLVPKKARERARASATEPAAAS